ncbi:MAG: ACT domain-containing protein [Oscillospiraceae bacterium]|nr:ACT domain-containing protein [Oscillospiraceae bacterium]
MTIKTLNTDFTVCKVTDYSLVNFESEYCFTGKTDRENSLVCLTQDTPVNTTDREDGWRGFRIEGVLDFSLVGILSKISAILADAKIGIFAVSTFNTDYIFVKQPDEEKALATLAEKGYTIIR